MYWKAVWLLLTIRGRLTVRTFVRSSTTLAGIILFTLVFGPAAFAAGNLCEKRLAVLPPAQQSDFLGIVLVFLEIIWLLVLLAGGVIGSSARLSPTVIRSYPLPPRAFVTASAFGSLVDIPTLLALPLFLAIGQGVGIRAITSLTLAPVFACFALHVSAMDQAIRTGGPAPQSRKPWRLLALLAFLVAALALGAWCCREAVMVTAQGQVGFSLLYACLLFAQVATMICLADRWLPTVEEAGARTIVPVRRGKSLAPEFTSPLLSRLAVAIAVEWRNLWRNLPAHLPLRLPGQLVLGIFYGWISPNLGQDKLLNARDLCGMGALLYLLVWQVQFLTNRFGSEASTAALLLGFPIKRLHLLLVRNLTLMAILFPVDAALVGGVCWLLRTPQVLPQALFATTIALILFTAAGNIISVLYPYPIARRTEGFFVEPDRSLLFLYALLGLAVGGLFWSVSSFPTAVRLLILSLVTAGVYAGSLFMGDKLLLARERAIIARLDGE